MIKLGLHLPEGTGFNESCRLWHYSLHCIFLHHDVGRVLFLAVMNHIMTDTFKLIIFCFSVGVCKNLPAFISAGGRTKTKSWKKLKRTKGCRAGFSEDSLLWATAHYTSIVSINVLTSAALNSCLQFSSNLEYIRDDSSFIDGFKASAMLVGSKWSWKTWRTLQLKDHNSDTGWGNYRLSSQLVWSGNWWHSERTSWSHIPHWTWLSAKLQGSSFLSQKTWISNDAIRPHLKP